jgi:hypothetical protein
VGIQYLSEGGEVMNALKLEDVMKEWETEKLTTGQAIKERLGEVEKQLVALKRRENQS